MSVTLYEELECVSRLHAESAGMQWLDFPIDGELPCRYKSTDYVDFQQIAGIPQTQYSEPTTPAFRVDASVNKGTAVVDR